MPRNIIIDDVRIGYKDKDGTVIQRPTHFATGSFWSVGALGTSTIVWFGAGSRFFYGLPVSYGKISDAIRSELETIANEYAPQLFPDLFPEGIENTSNSNGDTNTLEVGTKSQKEAVSVESDGDKTKVNAITRLLGTLDENELQELLAKLNSKDESNG